MAAAHTAGLALLSEAGSRDSVQPLPPALPSAQAPPSHPRAGCALWASKAVRGFEVPAWCMRGRWSSRQHLAASQAHHLLGAPSGPRLLRSLGPSLGTSGGGFLPFLLTRIERVTPGEILHSSGDVNFISLPGNASHRVSWGPGETAPWA